MSSRAKLPITRRQNTVPEDDFDDDGPTGTGRQRYVAKAEEFETLTNRECQNSDDVVDSVPTDVPDIGLGEGHCCCWKGRCKSTKKTEFVYEFGWFDKLVGFASIMLFCFDLGGDIYLVVEYFFKRKVLYGALTTFLTAGPSIVTCSIGLYWYWLEYKKEAQKKEDKKHKTSNCLWGLRVVMTILQLGPIIRGLEVLYHGFKSRKTSDDEKRYHHDEMLDDDVDVSLLKLVECFLEAAPQLTLQLYVWIHLKEKGEEDVIWISIRIVLFVAAWMSLAISHVSYHRALRFSMKKNIMEKKAVPFYFIWKACEVGTRVLCISLFASSFHAAVLVPIGIHWVIMSVWLICQKTKLNEKRYIEIIFNIIWGYVMIFCFLNVRDGPTRFRYIVYYIIFYVENCVMLGFWFMHHSHLAWLHVPGLTVVVLMAGLHIVFQLLHYWCCHPTGDIELCLPRNQIRKTCYESLCHEAGENNQMGNDALRQLNMEIEVSPPFESR